jgi:hypothetical protein
MQHYNFTALELFSPLGWAGLVGGSKTLWQDPA